MNKDDDPQNDLVRYIQDDMEVENNFVLLSSLL